MASDVLQETCRIHWDFQIGHGELVVCATPRLRRCHRLRVEARVAASGYCNPAKLVLVVIFFVFKRLSQMSLASLVALLELLGIIIAKPFDNLRGLVS